MIVLIPVEAWDFTPNNNDELAIYDTENNIVGSGVYDGEHLSIAVWEDDNTNNTKNGMYNNEQFSIRYWNSTTNNVILLNVTWATGDNYYSRDGISIANNLSKSNKSSNSDNSFFSDFNLAPNPAKTSFYVSLNVKSNCTIEITIVDNIGRIINISNHDITQGYNKVFVPCKNLKNSSYRVVVDFKKQRIVKKLIIL